MNGKLTATLSARGRLKATLSKAIERVEPIIKPIEITENGEYSAPTGVHGFNPVNVNVPLKYEEGYTDGYQASQDSITLQEKTITENGEIVTDEGFTGMSKVTVAVPIKEEQEKTVEITENGNVEVLPDEGKALSKVNVNVNVASEVGKPYIDSSKLRTFSNFINNNPLMIDEIDTIDTSNGTAFNNMFSGCSELEFIPNLDTSNGTNFSNMFKNCKRLKNSPVTNTSKGNSFAGMFENCNSLTVAQLDISNATSLYNTFYACNSLVSVTLTTAKTNLDTSTFSGCYALKNITIGEGWAVNIYLQYSKNLTVESLHGMIENLADLTGQTAKTFQIGATNLAKIDADHIAMLQSKNWNYS